jgi:tetratricopeptide (TPR) repeat protein
MLVAIALCAPATASCRRDDALTGCPGAGGAAIDQRTMAFLSIARALHHEADIDESRGDLPGAIAVLDRLVTAAAPRVAEAEEVLADAHARLAELRLKGRDLDGADLAVHAGLEHAREPTYFRGHLIEVQGLVEEARANALADAGKTQEAQRAKDKAMGLLEQAVRLQERVIERALADGGPDG